MRRAGSALPVRVTQSAAWRATWTSRYERIDLLCLCLSNVLLACPQYISGMAQFTQSIFWFKPSGQSNQDPFVAWITEVSGTANPPLSNSISWSSAE